jgi:hypothetical protein
MNIPYEQLIKILEECAEKEGIPKKLVKEIYDLEKAQTHLTNRGNEIALRQKILSHLEKIE